MPTPGVIPGVGANRIRGQCTSTHPLDYCTLHCSTNTQHVDIHTVNESVRNNSSSNNNTPPNKEGVERSTTFFWTIDKRTLCHERVQVGYANVNQRSLSRTSPIALRLAALTMRNFTN